MRIDKFLKVSRLLKRRTVAKELLNRGEFQVNGKVVKPAYQIKVGDIVVLSLGRHLLTIEMLKVLEHANKEESQTMYKVIEDKINNEIE